MSRLPNGIVCLHLPFNLKERHEKTLHAFNSINLLFGLL